MDEASGRPVRAFDQGATHVACTIGNRLFVTNLATQETVSGPELGTGGAHVLYYFKNYLAAVGNGQDRRFPRTKLTVWELQSKSPIVELDFRSDVLNVALDDSFLVVTTYNQIHAYTFGPSPQRIHVVETGPNPQGLSVLFSTFGIPVVAFPSEAVGSVQVDVIEPKKQGVPIAAHENALECLALSADNSLLATASALGTLIRVYQVSTGKMLRELRRGVEIATVRSLNFSRDGRRLLLASEKAGLSSTVHIFSVSDETHENVRSVLSVVGSFLPSLFGSEWSFAQFHVDEPGCVAVFDHGDGDHFCVISPSGKVVKCVIDDLVKCKCRALSSFSLPAE
jgi:WD40 repeat protein